MVKRISAGVGVLLALVLVWGVAIEPRLIAEERHNVTIPGLHPEWEGRRIAHLSDFQVGMWLDNPGTAARMVERLVEDRPDVVLLGGDLIYSKEPDAAAKLNTVSGIIRALPEAGIPTYAVLGNHEVELGVADRVRAALERIGVTVLSKTPWRWLRPRAPSRLGRACTSSASLRARTVAIGPPPRWGRSPTAHRAWS